MAGIIVVAEHLRGACSPISGELVGAALSVKDQLGGALTVLLIGPPTPSVADALKLAGVDEVVLVEAPAADFDAVVYEEAVYASVMERQPRLLIFGHTANGMAVGPAMAARLGAGFASDVVAIGVNDAITATRGAYGNKVLVEMAFPDRPVVVLMVRASTFKAPADDPGVNIAKASLDLSQLQQRLAEQRGYIEPPVSDIDITKSPFIFSIGRGIQDEKNVPRFTELSARLGATLGCSRPIADSGWLPKAHQVGLSGKVATGCKLYLAMGISGAVQHQHGMKHVETIIAVNTDPNAPIFSVATYGVCADLFAFSDALEREFG